jgi:hypothetical protein
MTHSELQAGSFRIRFLVAAHVRLVQGHDAAELVKIRYNFAVFRHLISDHCFRSFTGTADTYTLVAKYDVTGVTFRLKSWLALT